MATVSVVDRDRVWFLAVHGFQAPDFVAREHGLCAPAIAGGSSHVMRDALGDAQLAANPFVHEHQIRFYACAPITTSDGHRLGTVAVLDTDARTASGEQVSILEDLAAIVMEQLELRVSALDAVRTERRLRDVAEYERDDARLDRDDAQDARDNARVDRDNAIRDRDIAEYDRDEIEAYATVLQRTLLPPLLPEIKGAALASYYHPASTRRVGGDFYDVFALGDNRWAFFIGDVEGHGVDAAVATSLIRYSLRAAALHYSDLTRGLTEINELLLRELNPRRFCTVLFGMLEPRSDGDGFQVTIATGGHPPALLLGPENGQADPVRSEEGMLVGLIPNAVFDACSVHLRPGQTLLCYTDGIIEARRGANPFDEDRLAAFTGDRAGLGAAGLVEELATLIPKLAPEDDIALLAISAR
jgi:phosphoserine phosphatase RsbU/P